MPDTNEITALENLLAEISNARDLLTKQKKQLETLFPKIDTKLSTLDDTWQKHVTQCCADIVQQLEQQGIILNESEQGNLRNTASTYPSAEEAREDLAKKVKLPHNASCWIIATTAAVVANLSSKLQGFKEATKTVDNLSETFKANSESSDKLIATCKETLNEHKNNIKVILDTVTAQPNIPLPQEIAQYKPQETLPLTLTAPQHISQPQHDQ